MLILNEKKIRKGKPIGLPYVGSKKKVAKKIVEIIKQNFGTNMPVYDLFGGGGAITAECMLNGLNVHYNDLDKTITDMFVRVLSQDRDWIKTLIISREEFFTIREKACKSVDDDLKLLVNSFGNNRKDYFYSKLNSEMKFNLAVEIIKKYDCFSGYKQTDVYKNALVGKNSDTVHQLEWLQQLQQLQQLERLQQLNDLQMNNIKPKTTNYDYRKFSNLKDAVIYLDPPYEGTKQDIYIGEGFESSEFYDWAFKMAKNNVILISSYEISDPRFEVVYDFKTARSTFVGGNSGKKTEKLFMVKC